MTRAEQRTVVYCVVPGELAGELHDLLRRHWREEPGVAVIVERRRDERRGTPRRRRPGEPPAGQERRAVRSPEGRRVAERRVSAHVEPPQFPLPPEAEPHAGRLTFIQRRLPSSQAAEDVETARLVVEYQLGDRSALEDLYLRYFDRIYAYSRVALRNSHDAEDVTQQVFAQVVDALPRYQVRRGIPFRHWLFRIARNTMLDARQSQARAQPEEPAVLEQRRDGDISAAAHDALDWLTDADLYASVEELPPNQREVLVLRYVLDMTTKEIAPVLDRSPEAVRQLLSRALRSLERRLATTGRQRGTSERSAMVRHGRPSPVTSARRSALGP